MGFEGRVTQVDTLSALVVSVIETIFPTADQLTVQSLMREECSEKLPLVQSASLMQRIQLGVLKVSQGDIDKLLYAIKLARRDWRDLLMEAGFASDLEAHIEWAKHILYN